MAVEGVVIRHLWKSYKDQRGQMHRGVQDIRMDWQPGEFISIIGESGSGKSTLAKLLLGLEVPDRGSIRMDGVELTALHFRGWKQQRRFLQGVFQDASGTMNPCRSIYTNIEEALVNLTGASAPQRRECLLSLMAQAGLSEKLLDVPVRQLSGGEQRRFALIKALSVRPRYLVLDEVTSGLDLVSAEAVLQLLERCRQETNCGVLWITHDRRSAEQVSDRIFQMQQGRLVLEGIHQIKTKEIVV